MENNLKKVSFLNQNAEIVSAIHEKVRFAESIREILPELIADLKFHFNCEAVTLFAVDPSNHQLYSINYISDPTPEIRVDISTNSLAGYVAGTGKPLNISNVNDKEELTQYHPQLAHGLKWDDILNFSSNSMIIVPIHFKENLIGILEVINKKGDDVFSGQDFKLAQDIAPELGIVLMNFNEDSLQKNHPTSKLPSRFKDQRQTTSQNAEEQVANRRNADRRNANRRDNDKDEKIKKISQTINSSINLKRDLDELKDSILQIFEAERMTVFGLDSIKSEIYSIFQSREKSREIRLPLAHNNIAGHVAITKKLINILNVENPEELESYHSDLKFDESKDKRSGEKVAELLALPLIHEDTLQGVLKIFNKTNKCLFTKKDEKYADLVAENLAYAISKQEKTSKKNSTKFGYLIDNNIITAEFLASSIADAQKNNVDLESVLMEKGKIKRNQLGLSLENFYNLPYYCYDKSIILPKKILGGLNKNFLEKNLWIPIYSDNSKIVILINDPTNLDKIQSIKNIFPKKVIEFKVGLKVDVFDFLSSILEQDGNFLRTTKHDEISSLLSTLQEENDEAQLITSTDENYPESGEIKEGDNTIIRLVNKILVDAYDRGISDIHIEPGVGKDNVLIRFRKDGECLTYEEIPFLYKNAIISRIKIMAQLDIAERRIPQDGKFKISYGGEFIEFRVATCPTVGENEDVVLRILAKNELLPLNKMNFSEHNLEMIKKNVSKPYGLILVVGPTGSGKTTTLHSCLGSINTPRKKIWTVEDPVEITQKGIRQVQTLEKKGLNFARAMRSFLRGDPDVIMVGEMRDTETASIGLEASLTGHLVFSTLHTNSAPETITRLLDMGMNPLNFADSLLLIAAQRLVKTLCKNCCEQYHPSQEEFDMLVREYGEEYFDRLGIDYNDELTLNKPVGCKECDETGYAGRTAIHELLEGTQAVKRLVVKKASAEELRTVAIQDGMSTLKQDGIQKVFRGDCDLKQVLAVCII